MLRLPHELVRKNLKTTQRYVEREKDHILPALKDAANASLSSAQTPDQSLASLDAMIARMQTLKRKLQALHEEEENIQAHASKRIRHLQDLYDIPSLVDVKYEEWSRTRLDRLVVDFLLRNGYSDTATALATSKDILPLVDLDIFTSCHRIASSLQRGETREALAWIAENRAALKKLAEKPPDKETGKPLASFEYELRVQQYIELVRHGTTQKRMEAMAHAQKYLAPYSGTKSDSFLEAAGLLVQPANTKIPPYVYLFSAERWQKLSELFVQTQLSLLSLPYRPSLHVALSAGLSALKTPACHSQYNPASSSTPGEATLSNMTSLCPICSMELNELAREVPYAHHTKSYVENDPIVLPNGRIYGRERLEELQRKLAGGVGEIGEGEVRDPSTGEKFSWDEVRKVYIS